MRNYETIQLENRVLRERLSSLRDASLQISETLDLNLVLRGTLARARSLANAHYAFLTTFDDAGHVEDFLVSGLDGTEAGPPGGLSVDSTFVRCLGAVSRPSRVPDFVARVRELGLPDFRPPVPISSLLTASIGHRGISHGNIQVAKSRQGDEFTQEDEEILAIFASLASLAITNARGHRDGQHARTELKTLINAAPVGLAVFGRPTGQPVLLNSEAKRIVYELRETEQSQEQLLESMTIRRADGQELSIREFPLARVLSTGETVPTEEIMLANPGGRSINVLLSATPIFSGDGAVQSVALILQDMTPKEELERQRSESLAMVSHELRAPLASIKGSASTLTGFITTLDQSEMLLLSRLIDRQADHMSRLITDLLDAARIDAGTIRVLPVPSNLLSIVDEARKIFTSAGGRNDIRIDLPLDLPSVLADHGRVVQVLENLLSNASRHSPQDSTIRVSAARDGPNVVLSVADGGDGLAEDQLAQVFRKFTRIGAAASDGTAGSGLGLTISKGIVEAQGGRIWAESDGPGLGARFMFTLPVVDDAGQPASAISLDRHGTPRRTGNQSETRILVVDDDPEMLIGLRDQLSNSGYSPIVTGDPNEVGQLLDRERPHLVLLDLLLPGNDGISLMESTPGLLDVPVIFLSAYGRDQIIADALEAGADDYIVKPFSSTELVARIETALRRVASKDGEPTHPYRLGELTISYVQRRVYLRDQPVPLTDIEYRLLFELSVNAGRVQTHRRLLQRVWGAEYPGDNGPLRTVVKNLRSKLADDAGNPTYIFTELRVGYWMPKV